MTSNHVNTHPRQQRRPCKLTNQLTFGLIVAVAISGNLLLAMLTGQSDWNSNNKYHGSVNETAPIKGQPSPQHMKAILDASSSSLQSNSSSHKVIQDFTKIKKKSQAASEIVSGPAGISLTRTTAQEQDDTNRLRFDAEMPSDRFCLPWTVNSDDWWTHHPEYHVQYENTTHYCFAPIRIKAKADLFQQLYQNQFHHHANCSHLITQRMGQSGWGADFAHIVDSIYYGLLNDVPIQVSNNLPWHYASRNKKLGKNDQSSFDASSSVACPLESMYCYFLNLSKCPPQNDQATMGNGTHEFLLGHPNLSDKGTAWIVEYVTRPQTWLRKATFDFSRRVPLTKPCKVLHVRRADVVLHGKLSRRYHGLEEYIFIHNETIVQDDNTTSIFLLTDDSNAIQEAHDKFPNFNWVYIDRPRFKGAEGGWENQIPSNNPKMEVIVLLSIFRLVKRCDTLVHSFSNLGMYIAGVMKNSGGRKKNNVKIINLDDGLPSEVVFNARHNVASRKKNRDGRK